MKDNFFLALKVNERINAFRKSGIEMSVEDIVLDKWTDIRGLSCINDTKELCELNNIDLKEFTYALKEFDSYEKDILNKEVCDENWYKLYKDVINHFINQENTLEELKNSIAYPVRPFILYIFKMISDKIEDYSNIEISESAIDDITNYISGTLADISIKVVTLALYNYKQNNKEDKDIFEKFMEETYEDKEMLIKFYEEYPTMTRQLVERMNMVSKHIINILDRLNSNYLWIEKIIDNKKLLIKNIGFGQGDTHAGGQSVAVIEFEGGSKIVYKPRNLLVEKKFNELLDWVNNQNYKDILHMEHLESLYYNNYTLCQYVNALPCNNEEEVKKFYTRLGQLLFILYSLNGTDFHYENIISSGGQAYLIDLETLFQMANVEVIRGEDSAEFEIYKKYADLVLSIGILPLLGLQQNSEGKSVDISALNGKKQKLPYKVLGLKNVNTADMKFEYDYAETAETNNVPVYNNKRCSYNNYINEMSSGFNKMAQFILVNKKIYINEIRELFSREKIFVRQLTKATANYGTLLQYKNHPNYLKDMIYMERLLENLMAYPYKDKRIVPFEIRDMHNGDIPIFYSVLDNNSIYSSRLEEVKDYFSVSPLDRLISKIENLSQKEINEELNFLLDSVGEKRNKKINEISKINEVEYSTETVDYEEVISLIKDDILNQRIFNKAKNKYTWQKTNEVNIAYEAIDNSYFEGLSGVAVMFYELFSVNKNQEYLKIYKDIVNKLSTFPKKIYSKNPKIISQLAVFTKCNSIDEDKELRLIYDDWIPYISFLADSVINSQIVMDGLEIKVLIKLLLNIYKEEKSTEIYNKMNTLKNKFIDINKLNIEDVMFLLDKDMIIFEDEKESILSMLITYAEDIISKDPNKVWKEFVLDTFSGGVLYVVNSLVDIFNITKDERYIEYAKKLSNISINSYTKNKVFRVMSSLNCMNVSINSGYSGLLYTLYRVYKCPELSNIFVLNI